MASHFEVEPSCRMAHSNESALGAAATAAEGKETTNHQEEGFTVKNTAPASYLVLLVAAGLQQIVAHATDFSGAIALITSDATRRFGLESIEHTITTGDYVRMTTTVGLEVEYRLIPHDRPVPEDELSAAEVDALDDSDEIDELDDVIIDSCPGLTAIVERHAGRTTVVFSNHPDRFDGPEILVDDIPQLIGALGRFYADHHPRRRNLRRNEDTIRAAADVREGL